MIESDPLKMSAVDGFANPLGIMGGSSRLRSKFELHLPALGTLVANRERVNKANRENLASIL